MNCLLAVVCGLSVFAFAVAQLPPGTDICSGRADVIIAIPVEQFQKSPEFETYLTELVSYFDIGPSGIQVGLMIYGRTAVEVLSLEKYNRIGRINTGITFLANRQLSFEEIGSGAQDLVKAFETMGRMFENSFRANSGWPTRKIGVIFTEGRLSGSEEEGYAVLEAAKQLNDSGVVMYNIGQSVISSVPGEFAFIGTDFCRLFGLGRFQTGLIFVTPYLASAICSELDPDVNVKLGDCFPKTYASNLSSQDFQCRQAGMFPDFNNCNYFYVCVPGHPVYRMQCAGGTVYNPSSRRCVFPGPELTGFCQ